MSSQLSAASREALMKCFATRGPRKGRLLARPPGGFGSDTYVAWQAAMLSCNPFKVSIMSMMLMRPEQRAIFEEITKYFDDRPHLARECDLDRFNLSNLGVW